MTIVFCLQSAARIVLDDEQGSLLEQLEHRSVLEPPVPAFDASRAARVETAFAAAVARPHFRNGLGGFTRDGHEYVITLSPGQMTPAPWVNVLANPSFGTVISESGGAYTWVENAHEFRLTPWFNDPVQRHSPARPFTSATKQTGQIWSPTPVPARGARRLCRFGTDLVTPFSSTPSTASFPSCGFTWRWTRQ